jgi:hypothetical protein
MSVHPLQIKPTQNALKPGVVTPGPQGPSQSPEAEDVCGLL